MESRQTVPTQLLAGKEWRRDAENSLVGAAGEGGRKPHGHAHTTQCAADSGARPLMGRAASLALRDARDGRHEGAITGRQRARNHGYSALLCGRTQHNIVKQLSSN